MKGTWGTMLLKRLQLVDHWRLFGFFYLFFYAYFIFSSSACRYIDQRRQWLEKPNSQALGSTIWWLARGLQVGTGAEPDTFQTVFLSPYADPSTTLPLKPVENLFFLSPSLVGYTCKLDEDVVVFLLCFFAFPCRAFQFSLLVKPRRSRHLVLCFDLWRRGLGGGSGGGREGLSEAAEAKTVRGVCCLPPPSPGGVGNKWK